MTQIVLLQTLYKKALTFDSPPTAVGNALTLNAIKNIIIFQNGDQSKVVIHFQSLYHKN